MNNSHSLQRVLGPVGATAVVVGAVIGAGVFFKANIVAQSVGRMDLVILVWILCGVVSLCGALSVAELAAAIPHAGGQYVYLRRAYGPLAGFLWGWTEFWVLRTGSTAALAVIFATSLRGAIGPALQSFGVLSVTRNGDLLLSGLNVELSGVWTERSFAIAVIVLLTFVNVVGAHWGGWVQSITTVLKAGTLVALMIVAFGVSFEFPVVLVFLLLARVLTTEQLRRWRRWALVLITLFAALITPSQDPYSLLFMAAPMYLFYESSILIGRMLKR